MLSHKPLISISTLTYNRAHLLERTIKSVLNQTYENFELILVDNGSTDHTQQIFDKYKDHEKVRVFRLDQNIGFARGYNFCLDQIKGEWFSPLDDDDEIVPTALEEMYSLLQTVDQDLTAINCNGWDTETGNYSGTGLDKDQYLTLETIVKKCGGDFWGITKTELIDGIRLNPRIPGLENTFWYKVDAKARRYYIHKPLITYHTDHAVRETKSQNRGLDRKALLYKELLEEDFFWEVLQKYNHKQFITRCLKAICFLKIKGHQEEYRRYKKMLYAGSPGILASVLAIIMAVLPAGILDLGLTAASSLKGIIKS